MRVAQFKSVRHGYSCVMNWPDWATDRQDYQIEGYVRVSEWVDVEFQPVGSDRVVAQQVSAIDAMRAQVVEEFSAKLKELDDRKAELLALTHEVANAAV